MFAWLKRAEPVQRIGFVMVVCAALVIIAGSLSQYGSLALGEFFQRLFADLYANIGTELASIAITVLIIDRLNERRAVERQKESLVLQMGSPDNGFAVEAVRMLTAHGWLHNGLLHGRNLSRANLEAAHLQKVDFQNAHLVLANLRRAWLNDANLQGACLQAANLDGAVLHGARLSGANLNDANLVGAHFSDNTLFDRETILPDCTYWEAGADLSRFTDPQHPQFWRSRNPNSPARAPGPNHN